jgi:transposase
VAEDKEAFVGIDVAKLRNAVAIADAGRDGEVPFYGEVDASPDSMRRLAAKLVGRYQRLHFCHEAGPTGYGLHRLLTGLGHSCIVVAPSLAPSKRAIGSKPTAATRSRRRPASCAPAS